MSIIKEKLTTFRQFQIILITLFITSSASSIIMISMLSLFESITHSSSLSSLEKRKLIPITFTFIFNKISTPRIAFSYWFTIIFFFVLKKIPISQVILFLIALLSFFILKNAISFSSLFSLKIFFAPLIMLFSIFF